MLTKGFAGLKRSRSNDDDDDDDDDEGGYDFDRTKKSVFSKPAGGDAKPQ